ncbi:MAG: hypothetical protein Kow0020_01450 [Wenzhouxiangellaceae bacterium]
MVAAAEQLAEKSDRSDDKNQELATLLADARKQIELAEALGYGTKEDFAPVLESIREIERKSAGGKSGKGWFDTLKQQLAELF